MTKVILFRLLVLGLVCVFISGLGLFFIARDYEEVAQKRFYRGSEKVWAHRGYLGVDKSLPENSISAFRSAANEGAKGIELDIFYDADLSDFIVSHDKPYQRHNGQLLTVVDVVSEFGDSLYYWFDFKNLRYLPSHQIPAVAASLSRLLTDADVKNKVLIESQNPEALAPFASTGIQTSYWIGLNPSGSAISYWYELLKIRYRLQRYGVHAVSMEHQSFDQRLFSLLPTSEVYVFTVNDVARIETLAREARVRVILSDENYFRQRW